MKGLFSPLRRLSYHFFPRKPNVPCDDGHQEPQQRPTYHAHNPQPLPVHTNDNSQVPMDIHDGLTEKDTTAIPEPFSSLLNVRQTDRASTQLFALIIGIDDYTNCRKLSGAVADARAMKKYLREALQVPEDHLLTLYDREATRDAIIGAFKSLRNDRRINDGDPIVVFYAGHGGEFPTPHGWGPQRQIQCLLPQDYQGTNVIPDRTIGALIEDIAKVKGDNITLIFDCCHSASGTRGMGYVPRAVQLDVDISEDLDRDIWSSRALTISSDFAHYGLQSHVLLAACGEKELAFEHEGRGQFTNALLETLESSDVNNLTYTQLLERIQLPKQNPHCEGVKRHRVLFDGKISGQIRHSVHIQGGGKYVITAGSAHGISRGAEFTLYDDRNQSLGSLVIDDAAIIEDFETTVIIPMHPTNVTFAKLTRVGKSPIYLAPGGNFSSILDGFGSGDQQFQPVEEKDAKLEVAMQNDRVVFQVLDQRVKGFGLTKLPYEATLDNIGHVLASAAHFYWFLGLTREYHGISGNDEVVVDFYSLEKDYDDDGLPLRFPIEPGFCRRDPDLGNPYVIDFVVDPGARYGIKITNNTPWDLYLNVFLFNISSLSIAACYTQSSAGSPEAPLKRQGTFTIGYGTGGTPPFSYSLEESQDVDVGYLKAFFSTRPIDLSDVVRTSPFSGLNARGETDGDDARKVRLRPLSLLPLPQPLVPEHTWFTLDIPVVQRRQKG